jgi:hypothetical protein
MAWLSYSLIAFAVSLALVLAFSGRERVWRRVRFLAVFGFEIGGIILATFVLVTLAQLATAPRFGASPHRRPGADPPPLRPQLAPAARGQHGLGHRTGPWRRRLTHLDPGAWRHLRLGGSRPLGGSHLPSRPGCPGDPVRGLQPDPDRDSGGYAVASPLLSSGQPPCWGRDRPSTSFGVRGWPSARSRPRTM